MVFPLFFFYGFLIILLKSTWHGILYSFINWRTRNYRSNLFIYNSDSCPSPFDLQPCLKSLQTYSPFPTHNPPLHSHSLVRMMCFCRFEVRFYHLLLMFLSPFDFLHPVLLHTTSRNHTWYVSFCFNLKVEHIPGTKFLISRFVRETVAESNVPGGGVAKVE